MQDRIHIENAIKQYESALDTRILGRKFILLDEIDSTNAYIRRVESDDQCEGMAVAAMHQNSGRGRLGRSWLSEGYGLYLSVAVFLNSSLLPGLPIAAACAVTDAFESLGMEGAGIKWPNDIIISGKKVCGILCQAWGRRAAVGIGVNICQSSEVFQKAELPNAASLSMLGYDVDRWTTAAKIVTALEKHVGCLEKNNFEETLICYRTRCVSIGREVIASGANGEVHGTAVDIDGNGSLVIDTGSEKVHVSSGEVRLRTPYGYL